ncbi:MAG: hypothetical protein K8R90_03535, partial [Candidatus Cloacimonetes bacterium]|nr:hypothetical protein [Candidatus Cloacimonadota bacterium]
IKSPYMNRWEWFRCSSCPDPCEEYRHNLRAPNPEHFVSHVCPRRLDTVCELECINCGESFQSRRPIADGLYVSLCDSCQAAIGQEIEIWQRLFGSA